MKHRLTPLLEGMEMGKSEHDWLEQRLENMTAKEELLFRGAMQIESPRDIQTTIQILQGLDHYQLLYGAEDDVLLGRFVMEHIHTPTHAARGYLDPEIVGAAYREHGSGSFVENHYVERLNPDRPLPEVNPNVPLPITGEYAIRVKLVSRNNMEGVWIGFPDTGEYMDTAHPDELLLGLDALQAETLDQCMAVDVDCALPQITDILNQYDSAGELVRHAIDFGYVWAEQGQGEPHWMEKWQCVMELEDCHRLDLALDLAQNLHCYEFIPRGVDLAQYGMDLARKEGVLGQDPLLIQCFDSVAYQGTGSSTLAKGAGHFTDTSIWDGTVALAGHNRGVNNHFGKIHTLEIGDKITLTTKLGTRTYKVTSVSKVSETDRSAMTPTGEDRIVLYTCVMNQSAYRWCVQATAV